jgi:hypothetical protein
LDLAEIKSPTRPASDRYLSAVAVDLGGANNNIRPSETIAFLWRPTALDVSGVTMTADWLSTPGQGALAITRAEAKPGRNCLRKNRNQARLFPMNNSVFQQFLRCAFPFGAACQGRSGSKKTLLVFTA